MQLPAAGDTAAAEAFVREHLGDVVSDEVAASPRFRGGQTAADAALAELDVTGYASRRNEVWPPDRRGATAMSPYIRHGLLPLRQVWDQVADAPGRDRSKYRDELLWQEYSRHLYARVGRDLAEPIRYDADAPRDDTWDDGPVWDREMVCLDTVLDELETDGWLVNQTRMWLASHWTVRRGAPWRVGEDRFFTHLLDGSRAANRTGWQWTVGAGNGKRYGFSRWQVEKRAPELCARCPLAEACPIEDWPDDASLPRVDREPGLLRSDGSPDVTGGPLTAQVDGEPEAVWLTAESLGDADPALAAHPDLPAVFVFDHPLLERLRLSGKRLVFLTETLADLATRREVEVHVGDPIEVLRDRPLATTFAPVPGWRRRSAHLDIAALHPWPWLVRPHPGKATSFSAWRKAARTP